ncbi:unnamed protein product [Arctogadus glacialis]
MNPDGFDDADTQCLHNQGRYNHNGVDLNRNFPDIFSDHSRQPKQQREPEVEAVMSWLRSETFVLSANLHGGALVASYPYDSNQANWQKDFLELVSMEQAASVLQDLGSNHTDSLSQIMSLLKENQIDEDIS